MVCCVSHIKSLHRRGRFHHAVAVHRRRFVWGSPVLFVSDPDAIKRIFVTNHKNYAKDKRFYTLFGRILGKGLVTSEGALWKAERALMSPAFHITALGRLIPCFTTAGQRLV